MSVIIQVRIWLHGILNLPSNGTEVMVRQIAGAMARRIITYAKENIDVKQGDELGFIKFGSRVDVFLPIGTEVEIPILQQVKANKSIIAKI